MGLCGILGGDFGFSLGGGAKVEEATAWAAVATICCATSREIREMCNCGALDRLAPQGSSHSRSLDIIKLY